MEINAFADMRAMMLISCFLAGSVLLPDASENLSLVVVQAWKRTRARLRELVREARASGREPFWQIDMTKFEP